MTTVTHIKREAGVHAGIPVVATASQFTAPIHIDVGGNSYTSSLHTTTPDSKLSRMFSGGTRSIPGCRRSLPLCTGGSPDIIVHVERALVLPPPVDRREVTSTSGTTLAGPFGSGMVLAICLSMVMHPTWNKNINFCFVANNKSKIPGNVGTGSVRAGLVDHTGHVLRVSVRDINHPAPGLSRNLVSCMSYTGC